MYPKALSSFPILANSAHSMDQLEVEFLEYQATVIKKIPNSIWTEKKVEHNGLDTIKLIILSN